MHWGRRRYLIKKFAQMIGAIPYTTIYQTLPANTVFFIMNTVTLASDIY